jgi:hypothetical protein
MGTTKSVREQNVVIVYDVLPEVYGAPEDPFEYLPEQIDVKEVWIELENPKTGKKRRINITEDLSAEEILRFEDNVLKDREEIKRQFLLKGFPLKKEA